MKGTIELEEEFNELDKKMSNLFKKLRANLENFKKESNRWRAERNQEYHAINGELCVDQFSEYDYNINDLHYKFHNYFQTKEEAQAVADNIKTHIELMELAEELNKEPIDWNNSEQRKYYLLYLCDENKIGEDYDFVCKTPLTVYCTNENFKEEAIKRIDEERLVKYLKGR